MQPRFQLIPEGEPSQNVNQFLSQLGHDPGFDDLLREHYTSVLAMPETPETAEIRRAAATALRPLTNQGQGSTEAK